MRRASAISKLVGDFQSKIDLVRDGHRASTTEPLEILLLAAECGSQVMIEATGPDAEEAVEALAVRRQLRPQRLGGLLLLSLLDRIVDLSAVNRHVLGGVDPQPHLVATYIDHRDDDIVTDDNALVFLSRQDEHDSSLGS